MYIIEFNLISTMSTINWSIFNFHLKLEVDYKFIFYIRVLNPHKITNMSILRRIIQLHSF